MARKLFQVGTIPKGIGIGLALSIATTILGTIICAWLLSTGKIQEGSIGYIAAGLILLSSILAATVSVKIIKQKRLVICLIDGAAYFLLLLSINAIFYQGMYSGVGENGLLILAGVISVALLGVKGQNKPKMKRHK